MSFRAIANCLLITAAGAAPAAHSAPLAGAQVNQLRASIVEAAGYASTPQGEYSFTVKSYVDFDGSRAGFVSLDSFAFPGGFQFINCTGPEFANAVTMNQSTGVVSVSAAVDPSNPNCYAYNYFGAALTVRFSGQPEGNERVSQSGAGTQQLYGETFKFNFQSDAFSEVFTGTTGLYTGVFTGRATSGRSTNRTRTK